MKRNSKNRIASFLIAGALASMAGHATEGGTFPAWTSSHADTEWAGSAELWLDPAGDKAEVSDASLQVAPSRIDYTWSFRGKDQEGEIVLGEEGLRWRDSWHQPEPVRLEPVRDHGALLAGEYSYSAPTGPDWHWRVKLAQRPDGTLVLQMTNIAPWGEEVRAVRMVFQEAE
ncbi:MAG: hypothetical protein R3323_10675 [Wenzhouxiangellaceae bacterium]|nr:hypothetical protein [Wenzhouxiangellaceae bacterium]